ncbi:MAG: 2-C-methyl-D-erythritol 4-phosphate cytidylyltransferase [Thiohalocapsa sp.]|jgi:2-C-methyl-D-erythritol 4-phosphate cytidylyltransferase|nr:2-C-methyl-D-erythritol 4-phosphate cytidylyltransferase [Thiohalocapsa sp.]MCF7991018.1 2-C-methyl-D-erythritol 4-phosphate cytidylyltransferase [Thiohalocapsa sp.]
MSPTARHWVLIPAAGAGKRFGAAVPKQYLPLAGAMVIDHVLGLFAEHPAISGCVVALSPEDGYWADSLYADHPRVRRAVGGRERCHSVANALETLAREADDDDWVLVHDAARPCLRPEDLDLLLDVLASEEVGALLAVPVHDTVKQATADDLIEHTVPRERLWRAYTPQAFKLGLLRRALAEAEASRMIVTDDASAVELLGLNPRLVEGRADNIKITRPDDLALAHFFLQQQGRIC